MNRTPIITSAFLTAMFLIIGCESKPKGAIAELTITKPHVENIEIKDGFWGSKLKIWRSKTITDVFDKFEGNYLEDVGREPYEKQGKKRNAFENFDLVAEGKRDIGEHNGPPWYDGLVYETIRAAGDFLKKHPDNKLKQRVDGYIDRIAAAQASDSNGFIDTYTQLIESDHRWGRNGGLLRWQHDVYNAGMLLEAGVHYYKGTGNPKLLEVAVKMANYMCKTMGPSPKLNIIPAHAGPEEALIDLYKLLKDNPALKEKINASIDEKNYYDLVQFWIEARGDNTRLPDWNAWGNPKSEEYIRSNAYADTAKFGNHSRPTFGDYAQDSIPVLHQKTMEGHAVRATLLATGVTAMAIENKDSEYSKTSKNLWDNMVGKRMSINGGVGTIANDEKFGPDYFLPNNAYLETCAAVGAGFFSQKMNMLEKDGKYIDAFERVLYNNVLSGVSLDGDNYTYENPLESDHHHRWDWHGCPCCPPMFLKMVSALPDFIYAVDEEGVFVNLFVQSDADIQLGSGEKLNLKQTTQYPWDGAISLSINPQWESDFAIMVRIPEWAQGKENPYGLYHSHFKGEYTLAINGEKVDATVKNGYVALDRKWEKGDKITLKLPLQPRWVLANDKVEDLKNMAVLASGPVIFGFEEHENPFLNKIQVDPANASTLTFKKNTLGGVNEIMGEAIVEGEMRSFTAIPYYAMGNIKKEDAYKVWMPIAAGD